jgi:hypothetical protein
MTNPTSTLRRHPDTIADLIDGAMDTIDAHPEYAPIVHQGLRNLARDIRDRREMTG